MCYIWSQWNSAEIIDVCRENALQGARFGHNSRNVIQKSNSLLSLVNVGCNAEWSSSYPSRDFNLRRILEQNIVGDRTLLPCKQGLYESLYPMREIRKHSKLNSGWIQKCCFLWSKHKQAIKLQPRKILWHIRSPKSLRNSATNSQKPDTRHNSNITTACYYYTLPNLRMGSKYSWFYQLTTRK